MAALRGGAGLVRLAVPDAILDTVAGFEPSYMTVPLPADAAGRIAAGAFDRIAELAATGHGRRLRSGPGPLPRPRSAGRSALSGDRQADGLRRRRAQRPGGRARGPRPSRRDPRILTPHPGEFARLIGRKLDAELRSDAAVQLAARCGIVVVLKGHRTLVTDGQRRAINATGNPGMATGGTGDVLTGLITALACQTPRTLSTPLGWASICTVWPATWPPRNWAKCR